MTNILIFVINQAIPFGNFISFLLCRRTRFRNLLHSNDWYEQNPIRWHVEFYQNLIASLAKVSAVALRKMNFTFKNYEKKIAKTAIFSQKGHLICEIKKKTTISELPSKTIHSVSNIF